MTSPVKHAAQLFRQAVNTEIYEPHSAVNAFIIFNDTVIRFINLLI